MTRCMNGTDSSVHYVRVMMEYTMTIKIQSEYEVMPKYVQWTKNYYVLAGMLVLCTYNLIAELSTKHPGEVSTIWTVAHVFMIAYWSNQVRLRRRMDRVAREMNRGN